MIETGQTHFGEIHQVCKVLWASFLHCAFRMLIGWVGKCQSHHGTLCLPYLFWKTSLAAQVDSWTHLQFNFALDFLTIGIRARKLPCIQDWNWPVVHYSKILYTSRFSFYLWHFSCRNLWQIIEKLPSVEKKHYSDMKANEYALLVYTSEYPYSHALIGYSSSGYPVIFTGLQNKVDTRTSNHVPFQYPGC